MERSRKLIFGSMTLLSLVAVGIASACADDPDELQRTSGGPQPASVMEVQPGAAPGGPDPKGDDVKAESEEETEYKVVLKSGAVFEGVLKAEEKTTEDRFVVLVVAGVETSFAKKDIESFTRLPGVEERYKEIRAAIDDRDTERLINLAEWLRLRKHYDLASKEIAAALLVEPSNKRAKELQLLIEQQAILAGAAGSGKPLKERSKDAKPRFPTLTEEQMNLMKVYEVDLADPGRVAISRGLIEQLINLYGDHPAMPASREGREALYRAAPETIIELLFKVQARELYGKVKLMDTPKSLRLFREGVHKNWLMNSCATAACHGGESAGRFRLNMERPNTDPTVLTNLYIIERFRTLDGNSLIKYDAPGDSLLLQYALPAENARHPHPDITRSGRKKAEFKPPFRGTDDPRFQQSIEWVRSLYKPRPNYPLTLPLPGLEDQSIPDSGKKSPKQPESPPAPDNLSKAPQKPSIKPGPVPAPPAAKPGNDEFPK